MTRMLVGIGVVVMSVCASPRAGRAEQQAAVLDGTRWVITLTPDAAAQHAGEQPFADTLSFEAGQMTSTACGKRGFIASAYTANGALIATSFQTTQLSPKAGTAVWSGQVTGETIAGTLIWAKKDHVILHYTFEGKRATAS